MPLLELWEVDKLFVICSDIHVAHWEPDIASTEDCQEVIMMTFVCVCSCV